MRRRSFIGLAAAAGAAALWRGSDALTPQPEWVVSPASAKPANIPRPHRVGIIGAGLAGLSAGIELAQRGFEVDIYEAGSDAGGRAGGWFSVVQGHRTPQEHAFHAVFSHYYNLQDLITRAGADADYEPRDSYTVQVRGRGSHRITATRGPFPWPMARVLLDSPLLRASDMIDSSADALLDLLRFHPQRTFDKLDDLSFIEWCQRNRVPDSMFSTLYDPFVRTMFVRPEEVSAASVIRLMHAYFMGNPEGLGYRIQKRPAPESLIAPLIALFEKYGGRIHLSSPVHALALDGGRVAGAIFLKSGPPKIIAQVPLHDLRDSAWTQVATTLGPAAVSLKNGHPHALLSVCTHQGCPVAWREELQEFSCPCHGGRFDGAGQVLSGPPRLPLTALETRIEGGRLLLLSGHQSSQEMVPFDDMILATDPKGLSAIASATDWPSPLQAWSDRLRGMERCRPYSVARWWLDKPVQTGRPLLSTLGGYSPLDELFILSEFQEPARSWARDCGGSVIETHCYALEATDAADAEHLSTQALQTATILLPELLGARVIHRELQMLDNFPLESPGSHRGRPTTSTPVPNLYLAGDGIRIDLPAELMERAIISGRLAANSILHGNSLAPIPIQTPPLRGLLG